MIDRGSLVAIILILIGIGIICLSIAFEWSAYSQAIELAGGEPNVSAFIGWLITVGRN